MTTAALTAAPLRATPWAPPPGEQVLGLWQWEALARELDRHRLAVPASEHHNAYWWAEQVRVDLFHAGRGDYPFPLGDERPVPTGLRATVLAISEGLAAADLWALAPIAAGDVRDPRTLTSLTERVMEFAKSDPVADDSISDMVGWALAAWHAGDPDLTAAQKRRALWWEADLGADAWMYLAAGFDPAEAESALAAGTLDPAGAATVAALRGAPRPVGR